jgi:flagellar L-ring protein precursor FlgH
MMGLFRPSDGAPSAAALAATLGALILSGCATDAPGKDYFVKPTGFPVKVVPSADSTNGSVFPVEASGSLYGNQTFWQAGDIVTINVALSTIAQGSDSGTLNKSSSVNDSVSSFLGVPPAVGSYLGMPFSPSFGLSNQQQFTGTGATAGSNTVTTQLAAVVLNVEPNGILALSGRTNVNINGNVTGVEVTGYARPQDIGANNTLNSAQLANANIQYVGIGALNSAHNVPWLESTISRFWPF